MSKELLFWILMLIWLFGGFWREYEAGKPYPFPRAGIHLLTFVLFALLGWAVFGPAVK